MYVPPRPEVAAVVSGIDETGGRARSMGIVDLIGAQVHPPCWASGIEPGRSILVIVVLILRIRMKRITGVEEEVAQAHRRVLAAHRPALPPGEVLEVGGLLSEDAEQGLAPGFVPAEGVFRGPGPSS